MYCCGPASACTRVMANIKLLSKRKTSYFSIWPYQHYNFDYNCEKMNRKLWPGNNQCIFLELGWCAFCIEDAFALRAQAMIVSVVLIVSQNTQLRKGNNMPLTSVRCTTNRCAWYARANGFIFSIKFTQQERKQKYIQNGVKH